MIIDAGHRRWFLGTLLAVVAAFATYFWLDRKTLGGVSGGTTAGLWYGVAATALMVFCGAFAFLRVVPSWWWIGSRKAWLKAHIWLGLVSVVLVLCHSGIRIGGLMGQLLWVVLAAIIASGIFGVLVQQLLPSYLTRNLPNEASYEQIEHFCGILRGRADDLCDTLQLVLHADETDEAPARFFDAYERQIRPYLMTPPQSKPFADEPATRGWFDRLRENLRIAPAVNGRGESAQLIEMVRGRIDPARAKELTPRLDKLNTSLGRLFDTVDTAGLPQAAKAALVEMQAVAANSEDAHASIERLCAAAWLDGLEDICVQRGQLRGQERIHRWLHGWLWLHLPLSAALLILTIAHIVMSLYY